MKSARLLAALLVLVAFAWAGWYFVSRKYDTELHPTPSFHQPPLHTVQQACDPWQTFQLPNGTWVCPQVPASQAGNDGDTDRDDPGSLNPCQQADAVCPGN